MEFQIPCWPKNALISFQLVYELDKILYKLVSTLLLLYVRPLRAQLPSWKAKYRYNTGPWKNLLNGSAHDAFGRHARLYPARLVDLPRLQEPCETKSRFKHNIPSPCLHFRVARFNLFVPFLTAIRGYWNILIVFNHLTEWVKPSSSSTASFKNVVTFLLKLLFSRHGSPRVLLSETGLNSSAQVFTKLSPFIGTCSNFAGPYYYVTNGAVKRANGTLVLILHRITASNFLHLSHFLNTTLLNYCKIPSGH